MTIKITYIYKSQRFKPLHQAYISPGRYIMCLLLQEVHQSHFIPCAHVFDPFFLIPEIQAYKEVDPKYLTLAGSKDFTFGIYRDNPINSQ